METERDGVTLDMGGGLRARVDVSPSHARRFRDGVRRTGDGQEEEAMRSREEEV